MAYLNVLVSHAHDEKALAGAWKTLLESTSSGAVETWFSSDSHPDGGIDIGTEWRSQLYERLAACDFVLAIQTPLSAGRPWIMWECGVASGIDRVRGIIPVVFSLGRGDLANPLKSYQVYQGEDEGDVRETCVRLAEAAGLNPPGHIYDEPIRAYLETITLHRPRKPLRGEQLDLWGTRFEELVRSGRVEEVPGLRQTMYASFGRPFTPVDPTVHELLSKILLEQRQYAAAIEEIDYALSLVDNDVILLHRKALALTEQQNLLAAAALVEQILQTHDELRDNPELASLEGRIYRERWQLNHETEDLDRAVQAYRRACEADPTQYYPCINAASLALTKKDTGTAAGLFGAVLERCQILQERPVISYWVDFSAGEARLGLGDIAGAKDDYQRGLARVPPPPPRNIQSALKGIRRMIEAAGHPGELIDEFEQILNVDGI